jgi:hypothetical protein
MQQSINCLELLCNPLPKHPGLRRQDCHSMKKPSLSMVSLSRCGTWSRNYLEGMCHPFALLLKFDVPINREEQFLNYRTSAYKLHLFETLSGYKFVMLSDPRTDSLQPVLHQIYIGPFLEYVVRNPLVKMDSRERGIDNEYFRTSVDRLIRGLPVFSS